MPSRVFLHTSAEGAGGNNKSLTIVQPGNWLAEHKHTSWITQNRYTLVHWVYVCVWGCVYGFTWDRTADQHQLPRDRTRGEHYYYFTFTTLDRFTFWPRLEIPNTIFASPIQWAILTSRTVFMNNNSGRIRALLWYLIIAYQSHNNKNDHLTRPREGPRLNAWVSRYHYPRSSNKQLLLWKISSADN